MYINTLCVSLTPIPQDTNFFKRFLEEMLTKTGAFAALYAQLGLEGFQVVVDHFGPVQTDVGRLMKHYEVELERVLAQLDAVPANFSTNVQVSVGSVLIVCLRVF